MTGSGKPTPAASFAALHRGPRPLLLPNAWDHASAAALAAEGFPAVGTTSLGVAAAAGLPDGTGATRAETLDLAGKLSALPCLITVDIESGFSDDPAEVAELTARLAALGIAGINLEDEAGDIGHQRELIAAAKTGGLFVNARTDTHWLRPAGMDHDREALRRAKAYADAGADGVFVPGLTEEGVIASLVDAVEVPVNILYSPSGPDLRRLTALGVRRVSLGSLLFRAALGAAVRTAKAVAAGEPVPPGIPGYDEVQELADRA
ncbi:isocitrate lyase/phosphoenolpyruvate mutase family protein [Amycolatopsis rhizosphaerae]|uniref:Isocitrate lyase/phosphoenolpyruvate mutase family protein n=1 Tax=Amycolatopsis rhizosphaerae TaxID=2053003 RepID=A0A558C6B7_9PSEU|nr:isocitrate lyase/phosphoenolpyruvate mutase family protein [Amycolatopsis rhizosphaerae]TVT44298.1 isocitrate lyase/phosphoenolpyruvate mutase family protein [Amycolatopsis rhizosphaerae]